MKYIRFTIYIALSYITLCIYGCSNHNNVREVKEPVFPEQKTLQSKNISMDIVIKSGSIYLCGDYVLVYDRFGGAEYHYAVFDQNLKYLYSFCRKGTGPEECLMPTMAKDQKSSKCLLRDHANDRFHEYQLTDTGAIYIQYWKLPTSGIDYPFEINHISSGQLLLKSNRHNGIRRQLWNLSNLQIIDSLPSSFDYESRLGNRYHHEYDDFWMVADGNRFMCAYFFKNCLEFGRVDNEKLVIDSYWGNFEATDLYWYEDNPKTNEFKYNVDYNTVYYESVAAGLNKFWAGYADIAWGNINQHSKTIECYSLRGEPEVVYTLDESIESFVVLDNPKRIVGLNPDTNEDNFLVFDL